MWDFCLSHDPQGADIDPAAPLPGARPMAVPGSYNDQGEDKALRDHYGWAFYQKPLTLPALCAGSGWCCASGPSPTRRVWLDGRLIAEHPAASCPLKPTSPACWPPAAPPG